MPKNEIWFFGIVDTTFSPSRGYMEIVEKRDRETLFPIIQSVVKMGTTVHSDEWRAYANLQNVTQLTHRTVNHSKEFVARDGTH